MVNSPYESNVEDETNMRLPVSPSSELKLRGCVTATYSQTKLSCIEPCKAAAYLD